LIKLEKICCEPKYEARSASSIKHRQKAEKASGAGTLGENG
jgi:hypothetical protein